MIRRLLNALRGHGPWRLASFAQISRARTDLGGGVHRAEDFTGVLHRRFVPPESFGFGSALLDQPLNWEMLAEGPRYCAGGVAPMLEQVVYSLTDAGVITPDGIVYCRRSRCAVAESVRRWTQPPAHHPVFSAPGTPAPLHLPGVSLSLLSLSSEGFYHFFGECLPRLHLLRPYLAAADHVLCAGLPGGAHGRWLAHAGVDLRRVHWMHGLCHVRCDQILFTGDLIRDQQPNQLTLRALRELFPDANPAPTGDLRLWISRRDVGLRNLAWEDALLALLPEFQRVELGQLDPAAQLALSTRAQVIAGPHGAGLAQVVYAPPGGHLIELFPTGLRMPLYARLAGLAGVRHAWAEVDHQHPGDLPTLAAAIRRQIGDRP